MNSDQRRSQRVKLNGNIFIRSQKGVAYGMLENLSLHGIFARTDERMPVGENVRISFYNPDVHMPRDIKADAVVVRTDAVGIGLELCAMDLDSLILLRGIIGTRSAAA